MSRPTAFSVGPHRYEVRTIDPQREREYKGRAFADFGYVVVADDMPPSNQMETFWHEAVEVINSLYELELEHHKVTVLGVAIAQVHASVEWREGKAD